MSSRHPVDPARRRLLAALAAPLVGASAPGLVRSAQSMPSLPCGVASGDITATRATIWSRADRAARLVVEYDTSETFGNVRRVIGPAALEPTDYTARVELVDLPPGQRIVYRVRAQDLSDLRSWSEPLTGTFVTPPRDADAARDLTIAWSADTVGQGWGLNAEFGGLRLYETMLAAQPDLFVHCGDTIYADQPLQAEVRLADGRVWKNLVTEAKAKAAETLDEFRGNYRYNLLDEHMRRFNAAVPQVVLWDDHEVRDNWYHARSLEGDSRYTIRSTALLAARASRAFFDYHPIRVHDVEPERVYRSFRLGPTVEVFALDLRSYRGANSANDQPALTDASRILGDAQLSWLKRRLRESSATWKVIASDMPIGLVVPDMPSFYEAIANARPGGPLGRELELADLLQDMRRAEVRNVVWITGDVHYAAAHHYDPARAAFTDFTPFWEFVAGPLHAGTFGPNALDPTFGPEVRFTSSPAGMPGNRPPSDGQQFFGTLHVAARTRELTARLRRLDGATIFSVTLAPA